MTAEELEAIEARAKAATEGPWEADGRMSPAVRLANGDAFRLDPCGSGNYHDTATGEFIAAARTDVPALVAEVRRLQAENGQLREDFATQRRAAEAIYDAKIGR